MVTENRRARVAVNGYGVIGKRDDMELVGVAEIDLECTPKGFGAQNHKHYRR